MVNTNDSKILIKNTKNKKKIYRTAKKFRSDSP